LKKKSKEYLSIGEQYMYCTVMCCDLYMFGQLIASNLYLYIATKLINLDLKNNFHSNDLVNYIIRNSSSVKNPFLFQDY